MVECSNCNKTFDDDFSFCPYCGTKLIKREIEKVNESKPTLKKSSEEIEQLKFGCGYLIHVGGDWEKGLTELEKLKELDPEYETYYYFDKARCLKELGHYKEALQYLDKTEPTDEFPYDEYEYYIIKAECLKEVGHYTEELEYWTKIINIKPYDENREKCYYEDKADCLRRLGQYKEAAQYYDLSLKM